MVLISYLSTMKTLTSSFKYIPWIVTKTFSQNVADIKCSYHCSIVYIWMKKSMFSWLTSNLLIPLVILPTQKGSWLRESMYCLISFSISSLASCPLVLSNFSWYQLQYIYSETKFLMLEQHINFWTHFYVYWS